MDFPVQLAQLVAQSRMNNMPTIRQPNPGEMRPSYAGSEGWGPTGQAFGKGIGDYLQSTVVETNKKKYMEENDPQLLRQQATDFAKAYQEMTKEQREMIKKSAHTNPEAYMKLTKFAKAAPELYNIVKNDPGVPDYIVPIEFVPSKTRMEAETYAGMPQKERGELLTAGPRSQLATAGHQGALQKQTEAQTAEMPRRLSMEEEKLSNERARLGIDERRATADELVAASHLAQADMARQMQSVNKRAKEAEIRYHDAQARAADRKDPNLIMIEREKLQFEREQQQYKRSIIQKYEDTDKALMTKTDIDPEEKLAYRVKAATDTARLLKSTLQEDPTAVMILATAADTLIRESMTANGSVKSIPEHQFILSKSKTQQLDPLRVSLARSILAAQSMDPRSILEMNQMLDTYERLASTFWAELVPEAGGDPKKAAQIIKSNVNRLRQEDGKRILLEQQAKSKKGGK